VKIKKIKKSKLRASEPRLGLIFEALKAETLNSEVQA
jgi:hypothetical protein